MTLVIFLLIQLLDIYLWLIIASVIVSWLIVFKVLNTHNKWVRKGCYWLNRIVEPSMSYVRRILPAMGGIDLTPMVLIFGIYMIQSFLYGMLR